MFQILDKIIEITDSLNLELQYLEEANGEFFYNTD